MFADLTVILYTGRHCCFEPPWAAAVPGICSAMHKLFNVFRGGRPANDDNFTEFVKKVVLSRRTRREFTIPSLEGNARTRAPPDLSGASASPPAAGGRAFPIANEDRLNQFPSHQSGRPLRSSPCPRWPVFESARGHAGRAFAPLPCPT